MALTVQEIEEIEAGITLIGRDLFLAKLQVLGWGPADRVPLYVLRTLIDEWLAEHSHPA